jgi:hypothetical protein
VTDTSLILDTKTISPDAVVEVFYNQVIVITQAFPDGYDATTAEPISFSLTGFFNPPTTKTTDPFELAIFYEEGVNEVSRYNGTELTFTAEASDLFDLSIKLSPSSDPTENALGRSHRNYTRGQAYRERQQSPPLHPC